MAKKNKLYTFEVKDDNTVHHGTVLAPKKKSAKEIVRQQHGGSPTVKRIPAKDPGIVKSITEVRETYENRQSSTEQM